MLRSRSAAKPTSEEELSTIYLLNSAVMTSFGTYIYQPLSLAGFRELLPQAVSYIGYPETAEAIRILTGVSVSLNRGTIKMAVGDKGIIFRLGSRVTDPTKKGVIGVQEVLRAYEIGLLERTN